jgi:hypothetical protein
MHTVGLHEVSQAQVPGRVEAAKAIELLRESDASRLAEVTRTVKASLSEGGWQLLMLAKQFVSEEVLVQTYSPEGLPEVQRFKADRSVKDGMRVQVTMGTGLAHSRAARQDQILALWDRGIISDPEVAADLLEVSVSTFTPAKALDIRLARNENLEMAKGEAITPNSWDDHELHLREHNNFRKTAEYHLLEGDAKQKFEYHCQEHEVLQIQQLEKLVAKQQLLAAAQPTTAGGEPPQPTEQAA